MESQFDNNLAWAQLLWRKIGLSHLSITFWESRTLPAPRVMIIKRLICHGKIQLTNFEKRKYWTPFLARFIILLDLTKNG